MVEGLAGHAGRQVGDQGDAQHLGARLARGDGLQDRGHADQVRADDTGHADLSRGLVVRAGELCVDALLQGGVDLLAQGAQARGVQVGQVDEVGADDRRGRRQVDVVADQHRLAGAHALAQTAAAVGQDDRLAAGGHGRTDAVGDGGDATALVVVRAAQEDQSALVTEGVRADLAAVPLDGRRREAGQLGDLELGVGCAQGVDGRSPAGAHHEGDVVGLGAGQFAQAGGGGVGGGVRVALDVVRKERCVHVDEGSRSSPTRVDDRRHGIGIVVLSFSTRDAASGPAVTRR